MNKEIIYELNRIKSLMNLINEQGSADINIDRLNRQQLADAPDTFGPMDEYEKIEIGGNTKYPTVLGSEYKTFVMGNPNPILKQSGSGTKASDFIPNVKVDENGNEYIERNGKKYCLPDKKFWDAFNSKNYVYQIINPRNNKKFSMRLTTVGSVNVPTMDENGNITTQELKGYEAALKCLGGDNGWGWDIKNGSIFWTKEGDKYESYNTNNPEHFDTRSDFDVWWDKWGVFVEIGLGLLAAWTGAGLAASLIRLGLFANTGLASAYAAGNTTWLSVILQAGIEAGLMAPIASYQFSRDQDSNAILTIAFSFLPFLTELGSVQKFIKGGIQPGVSKSLGSKFLTAGGESAFKNNPTAYANFLESLTVSELMLWKTTIDQFSTKEGQKAFSDALGKYLKENEIRLTNEILGNKGWTEQLDDLTAGQFSKGAKTLLKQNPIKGTGLLAQFIRLGLPLVGVTIGFQKIYDTLKGHGYNDTQIEKITNDVKKSIDFGEFFVKIAKIDAELFSRLQNELLINYLSNKENTEKILNDKTTQEELSSILEKRAKEIVMEDPKIYNKYIEQLDVVSSDVSDIDEFLKNQLMDYLEGLGHSDITIETKTPLKIYSLNSNKISNGEIKINSNIRRFSDVTKLDYVNNVEIPQS